MAAAGTKVRITALRIKGFRSCNRVAFKPDPSLSILISPNAAAKTSILQALLMLKPVPHTDVSSDSWRRIAQPRIF